MNILERIEELPFFESYDASSQRLNLRGASYIPEEIIDYADSIKILDLSNGTLVTLPDNFILLKNLERIFLSENDFTVFPSILRQCQNLKMISIKNGKLESFPEDSFPLSLEWLVLTDNPKLSRLPESIGKLRHLRKLSLSGTGISHLPESLSQCREIEFLRISACQFQSKPPLWISSLPKLAWYGDHGNPSSLRPPLEHTIKKLSPEDIIRGEKIHESPSSIVYTGYIKETGESIAIKYFKQPMTSDGYAQDDIDMTLYAGYHPNLPKVYGVIHSQQTEDLQYTVSSCIPDSFVRLGNPPTLESCTRDNYPIETTFSLSFILKVLQSIAAACTHLHRKGISHGDLYAHNILVNAEGYAYLCDFGAATLYNPSETPLYQLFDIRAFGNLMEELIDRIEEPTDTYILSELRQLRARCQSENPEYSLTFHEISTLLNSSFESSGNSL